ncbi:MAG: hypothetical protein V1685_02870 [Parcubacteria group bacterium]
MRRVNRVLLYMVGVALIGSGLYGGYTEEIVSGKPGGHIQGSVLWLSILVVGIMSIVAARTRYRGGSPTVIGACMVIIGLFSGSSLIDNFILGNAHTKVLDILTPILTLLAAGCLIRAGHQLHRYRTKEDFAQLAAEPTLCGQSLTHREIDVHPRSVSR